LSLRSSSSSSPSPTLPLLHHAPPNLRALGPVHQGSFEANSLANLAENTTSYNSAGPCMLPTPFPSKATSVHDPKTRPISLRPAYQVISSCSSGLRRKHIRLFPAPAANHLALPLVQILRTHLHLLGGWLDPHASCSSAIFFSVSQIPLTPDTSLRQIGLATWVTRHLDHTARPITRNAEDCIQSRGVPFILPWKLCILAEPLLWSNFQGSLLQLCQFPA
jgi:hypothetical protein